jgi:uncharacterized protein YrrD
MATPSTVIRQSELLNQLILDSDTLQELGRVEVLWMYPPAHRVLGLISKSGWLGQQKAALKLNQIEAVGENGLLTHARPQETTADRVRQIESLIDHEVWSQDGDRLGKIVDCLFNLKTGEITYYLFVSSGWASFIEGVYQLAPSQILSFGSQRVLVAESTVAKLELYQAGISRKITQAGEALKDEAVQEFTTIAQKAEQTTEQAKEQIHQLTDRAKLRAQNLSQQLKGKTQNWLEVAREKGQLLAEQVREGSALITRQVEESIESFTTPEFDLPEMTEEDLDDIWPEDEPEVATAPPATSAKSEVPLSGVPKLTDPLPIHPATDAPDDDFWGDSDQPTTAFTDLPEASRQTQLNPPEVTADAGDPDDLPDDLPDDWEDEPWEDDQAVPNTAVLNQDAADRVVTSAPNADLDDDEPWI